MSTSKKPRTINYSCGFIFTKIGRHVLLLKRSRPEWQKGYFNGIGGHIEPGESAAAAMARECKEETGFNIPLNLWVHFVTMNMKNPPGKADAIVHFFFTSLEQGGTPAPDKWLIEEGKLAYIALCDLMAVRTIPNLQWLIPLAANWHRSLTRTEYKAPIKLIEISS